MSIAWLNGEFVDDDAPAISLRDTGLLHAAGVFTTMRAAPAASSAFLSTSRTCAPSSEALFVPLQFSDADLASVVDEVLSRNGLFDARLRLTVTRGQSVHDPLHGTHLKPNCFLSATELNPYPAQYYAQGLVVMLNDEQKLNDYDMQAGHKTLDYFSRLAALREAVRRGAGEALWFNTHNYLQSACVANVFIVEGGTLITPPTREDLRDPAIAQSCPYPAGSVLPGITRATVLELARANNIPTRIQAIDVNTLLAADEAFLTNGIMQLMPVGQIEQHKVGSETPGPITQTLMNLYQEEQEK